MALTDAKPCRGSKKMVGGVKRNAECVMLMLFALINAAFLKRLYTRAASISPTTIPGNNLNGKKRIEKVT